jgi:hypothetical protein
MAAHVAASEEDLLARATQQLAQTRRGGGEKRNEPSVKEGLSLESLSISEETESVETKALPRSNFRRPLSRQYQSTERHLSGSIRLA